MKQFRLVSIAQTTLSEESLKHHLSYSPIPGERPLKPGRVKVHFARLAEGTFNRVEWAYCKVKSTGETYRVNGQHTGHVLPIWQAEGSPMPWGIPAILSNYECETPEDLPDVFEEFDSSDSARTGRDKVGTYSTLHDDLALVEQTFIAKALGGVHYARGKSEAAKNLLNGFPQLKSKDYGAYLAAPEVRNFILCCHEYEEGNSQFWKGKAATIGGLFHTYLSSEELDFSIFMLQVSNGVPNTTASAIEKWGAADSRKVAKPEFFYNQLLSLHRLFKKALKTKGADKLRDETERLVKAMNGEIDEMIEKEESAGAASA